MRVSDQAIVLQAIRYSDRKYILKLYTRKNGLMSVAAVAGSSATSKVRSAHIQPMTLLDVQLVTKQNKDVQQLQEAGIWAQLENITGDVVRIGLLQFMNEVLLRVLKEQVPNEEMFSFVARSVMMLNTAPENLASFHVRFLLDLSRLLGIEPHDNYSAEEPYFDCREGRFSSMALSFPLGLDHKDSLLLRQVLSDPDTLQQQPKEKRQSLLDIWLAYYQLHLPGFNALKSVSVLKEVFSQ